MYTPLSKLTVAAISIKTKGKAIDIDPDWIADNAYEPPATNKTVATKPWIIAHITLCILGVLSFPPDVIVSMTNDPESEEVTKNNTNINREKILETTGNKRLSNM